ncbi:hypothetical protein DINM_006028 [Dirofilaria immitis]|nr:hypothetical protein [Dirofilaria immitis]
MILLTLWLALIRLLLQYPQSASSQKLSTSSVTTVTTLSSLNHMANQETCCGQCAVQLVNDLIKSIGMNETSDLLNLNYNNIKENFGCLARLDPQIKQFCMRTCTKYQEAFHSIARNFRHFILNSDATILENYLNDSCEYVLCSLHCDFPMIAHNCGYEIVEKVISLTRKSFKSMKKMSLDTAVISRWPQACAEVITYKIPERNLTNMQQTNANITIPLHQINQKSSGQQSQKLIKLLPLLLLSLIIYFTGIKLLDY